MVDLLFYAEETQYYLMICTDFYATNIFVVSDNKFRILKNGGVHAVLNAMTNFMDAESLQLNALKVLCNLVESGIYHSIVEVRSI